jgi:galactokinase
MMRFAAADPADSLHAAGMSSAEAARKARLFDRARTALGTLGVDDRRTVNAWFVPGRLEVLGKHNDYAGGRSLLCAIERGCALAAARRDDRQIRIVDAGDGSTVDAARALDGSGPVPAWAVYPATVVRRLHANFPEARCGADIAFESDLPAAAGMSSSSVLMIAVFFALAHVNEIESLPRYRSEIRNVEDLAGYLATIENGHDFGSLAGGSGVGTFGGSEDHTAIVCCRAHELAQYSFVPVRCERRVPLVEDRVFAIAVSGVAAEKTGTARSAYNDAAARARRILDLWSSATGRDDPSLAAAIRSHASAADRMRRLLDGSDRLRDRLDQFVEESERIVPEVAALIAEGRAERIGPLVDRSQELAERLLGNQVPETIALARSARDLGAAAGSSFGAGFGGSVWALVTADSASGFIERWSADYRQRFPAAAAKSAFFTTRPGPGALRLG